MSIIDALTNTFLNRRAAVTRILQDRLINAARDGHTAIVERLLAAPGIDVNAKNESWTRWGETALIAAARNGNTAIVDMLLAAPGIDVNLEGRWNDETALIGAAEYGHTAIAERVLAAPGIDVNAKNYEDETALILAARNDHTAIVDMLLAAGADVNVQDADRETALMGAADNGNTAIVDMLLAAPGIDVNAKRWDGETALTMAEDRNEERGWVRKGHRAVIRAIRVFPAEQAMNRWIPRQRDRQQDRIGFREFVRSTRVRGTYDGEEYEIDRLPRRAQTFITGFL